MRTLAIVAVVAAGFYPAAGLTLGAALALLLLLPARDRGAAHDWSLARRARLLVITAVAAGLVILPTALRLAPWGPAIGPSLVHEYPEAGPQGRFDAMDRPPFPALPRAALQPLEVALKGDGQPLWEALSLRASIAWLGPLCVVLGLLGWAWLARSRSDVRRLLLLPLALTLCHTVALAVEPLLFLPERYVAYAVPLVALLAAPTALGALAGSSRALWRVLPTAYNVLLVVAIGASGTTWTGLTIAVQARDKPLFERIAALPKNAVIAAFPADLADCIPYLTRRSAFLTRETHMPFHAGYTILMRQRALALFSAYYATSEDDLRRFRDEWGVTHLLLEYPNFTVRPPYFAPFEPEIARDFAAGRTQPFAALGARDRAAIYVTEYYALLDLGRL